MLGTAREIISTVFSEVLVLWDLEQNVATSVLQNAMVLILWDLLVEQNLPVEQVPPVTDANTQRLRSEWFGWETPMLACAIYEGLNGIIDHYLKNRDQLDEDHLMASAAAAENAKCVARMLKELVTAIPEDAEVFTRVDHRRGVDMQRRRSDLIELEIESPRARR